MIRVGIYIDTKWFNFVFDFLEIKKFDVLMINKAIVQIEKTVKDRKMPKVSTSNDDQWFKP